MTTISRRPVAGPARSQGGTTRHPANVAGRGRMMRFLAPPTTAREMRATRAPDCGELAMGRLRQPFAVAPETTPVSSPAPAAA
jgi:hypothetical protein